MQDNTLPATRATKCGIPNHWGVFEGKKHATLRYQVVSRKAQDVNQFYLGVFLTSNIRELRGHNVGIRKNIKSSWF